MKQPLTASLLLACCMWAGFAASAQVYPASVVRYLKGRQKDGGEIAPGRSNPANALGRPQDNDAPTTDANANYTSLGFGGGIVLRFAEPITQGPGTDVEIVETSYGSPVCARYPEQARVYFSQDGRVWTLAGNGCQNFGVELPATLRWALYIRIADFSDPAQFNSGAAEGFDVDGVVANYAYRLTGGIDSLTTTTLLEASRLREPALDDREVLGEEVLEAVARHGAASPAASLSRLSVGPNPVAAGGRATLRLTLAEAGPLTVDLYDLSGKKAATVFDGEAAAGTQQIAFSAAGLQPGVYLARAGSESVRVVVAE